MKTRMQVDVGCKVEIESSRGKRMYTIVNELENSVEGKISKLSPIGQALLGKKAGDKVQVNINSTLIEYRIVNVKN